MWIVNILLVLLFESLILLFYLKDNKKWFLISLILSYLLAPLIKVGNFELSSSYLYTATFVIIILKELIQKKVHIGRKLVLFFVAMSLSVLFMLLGLFINSSPSFSALFALAGYVQSFVIIACFSLYFGTIPKDKLNNLIFTAIGITTIANLVVTIIQFVSVDFGYFVIKQFYAQQYRIAPVETFKALGKINRGFGLTFSPVVLAIIMLIFVGWLIGQIDIKAKSKKLVALIFLTTLTGLLAISKTSILGILILALAYIVVIFVYPIIEKQNLSIKVLLNKSLRLLVPVVISFILAVAISDYFGLNFRRYLNVIMDPLRAFSTRYAVDDIDETEQVTPTVSVTLSEAAQRSSSSVVSEPETSETSQSVTTPTSTPKSTATPTPTTTPTPTAAAAPTQSAAPAPSVQEGILADTIRIIKHNPIIGVGPLAVDGEFLGDSQYAIILHHGGVLNALTYLLFYGYILIDNMKKRNTSEIFVLMMVAATGFGAVTIYMPGIGFLLGYCIREGLAPKRRDENLLEVRG